MKKLNISKEQYCKIVNEIKNFHKEREEFDNAIEKFSDGYVILNIGNNLTTALEEILEELTFDRKDEHGETWLSWWLYEDVEKIIYTEQDDPIDVRTPEKLYDYLEHSYEVYQSFLNK